MSLVVVLDLDDTLYLERDYIRSGFTSVGTFLTSEHGLNGFAETAWQLFEEGVRRTTFDQALERLGRSDLLPLVSELVVHYRNHKPAISLCPDAEEALLRWRSNYEIGVITDGPLESQRAKAGVLGAADWADLVVFTAELGGSFMKPHPLSFEMAQAQLGGERYAYVADNPHKDFVAPHHLGWRTVRIRREGGLHYDVPSGEDIDAELSDLTDFDAQLVP